MKKRLFTFAVMFSIASTLVCGSFTAFGYEKNNFQYNYNNSDELILASYSTDPTASKSEAASESSASSASDSETTFESTDIKDFTQERTEDYNGTLENQLASKLHSTYESLNNAGGLVTGQICNGNITFSTTEVGDGFSVYYSNYVSGFSMFGVYPGMKTDEAEKTLLSQEIKKDGGLYYKDRYFYYITLNSENGIVTGIQYVKPYIIRDAVKYRDKQTGYILPHSDDTYLTEADLPSTRSYYCQMAIDEIYARHGVIFNYKDIQDYFESQSWYTPKVNINDFSSDSVFNDYEDENIKLLANHRPANKEEEDTSYNIASGLKTQDEDGMSVLYTDYFKLSMPSREEIDWAYETTDNNTLSFYYVPSLKNGNGGFICSIKAYESSDYSYKDLPVYHIAGQSEDGYYTYVCIYPTDVQFGENEKETYKTLLNYMNRISVRTYHNPLQINNVESEYMLLRSNDAYLKEYNIAGMTNDEIQLAINEIYARHGVIFDYKGDESINAYFQSKSWYKGTVKLSEFTKYEDQEFNEYEKANIDFLADHRE